MSRRSKSSPDIPQPQMSRRNPDSKRKAGIPLIEQPYPFYEPAPCLCFEKFMTGLAVVMFLVSLWLIGREMGCGP